MYDNSPYGSYELDPEGNFVSANKRFLDIVGLNNISQLSELNAFKVGLSTNGKRDKLKQLILGNSSYYEFEDEWLIANNKKIQLKENIRAIKDLNGNLECFYGTVEDITIRKIIENNLFKNHSEDARIRDGLKFQSIVESAIDAIIICDSEGKILVWNKSAQNIFGYTPAEIMNQSIRVLVPESYRNMHNNGFDRFIKSREPKIMGSTVEIEGLRKDGSLVPISLSLSHWEEGSSIYFSAILKDITKQKQIEDELIKSKIEAEKSDRLKSDFLTQISHEIRTPVNTLLSFTALLKHELEATLPKDLLDSFQYIDNAGARIIRTIDLLVKISELHTGNYEPEFKENDLVKILEELIKEYNPRAEEKNITLQLINSIDSGILKFDRFTIKDVFSNIIDNAIKFTHKGSVTIKIKNDILNKVYVSIQDTGIGISERYMGNLFKPFTQETSGYKRKYDGNGLGLALVKGYCDLNKATINVSSEKGSGTNFTVNFS